jgi:hypothetical protein
MPSGRRRAFAFALAFARHCRSSVVELSDVLFANLDLQISDRARGVSIMTER